MTEQTLNGWPTDVQELRAHIEGLEQTLAAIRNGSVDAVIPGGESGEQLYSLDSADRPYRVIVEEMGEGALTISESGIILYANRRFAELVGTQRTLLLGRHVTELVDPPDEGVLADLLTGVPGATKRGEISLCTTAGAGVPVLASVTGLEIDGAVVRCLIAADLSDRRRAEQDLAQSAAELREAQRIGSIGSWHWNSVTDEVTGSAQMYRIIGTDPQLIGLTLRATLTSTHPEDATLGIEAFHRALIDQQPFVVEQRLLHPDGDLRHIVTRGEVICDPDNGGRTLRGTTQDVTEERRSAAAVVEAREALVRRTTQLAMEHRVTESLQRAVLPARLPSVPRVELAARYLPADRPSMVGGDWYDAFTLPGGDLAVAVGDVVGHDVDAGAMMGQLRNALRAYAFGGDPTVGDDPPDAVLARLNRLAFTVDGGALATTLFGHLDHDARTFRWACAGHMPPLVIGRAGVRFLPAVAGTLLGVNLDTEFGIATTEMQADDLVLLYTDGLIERRERTLDDGFAALADAAADLAGEPAELVCATLLDRLLSGRKYDDDVCLLAVRLLPDADQP